MTRDERTGGGRLRQPFGSWASPLSAGAIAAGGLRLSEPRVDHGAVYWVEGRPEEGGRCVLMRSARDGEPEACVGEDADVRTRVHEYGGGAYLVARGRTFVVDDALGRLCALGRGPIGRAGVRYADLALSPDDRTIVAVEEAAGEGAGGEPANRLVALDLDGERTVLDGAHDFVSSPVFAPDGSAIAWLAWDHPNMPWDETALFVAAWGPGGLAGTPRRVAGGRGESLFQPRFGPDGRLFVVSDRSGWWNLYVLEQDALRPVCPVHAEFATPQWALGLSTWDFIDDDRILCVRERDGEAALATLEVSSGELRSLGLGLTAIEGVRVEDGLACFLGASPMRASTVYALELDSRRLHPLRSSLRAEPDEARIALPEPVEFPSADGRTAHAFYYAPRSPETEGPADARPPLLVKSHGGPTGVAHAVLDLRIQYWTSRGIGVVDVNYGGSTSFGRAYRERLDGQWGVVDVEDCVHAARYLAGQGRVDAERLLITGGSAGGFTTLCALAFFDDFRAGASHYGIGDLEALARDTHKFESRYTDRLVAPHPARADVYRARSPIHHVEQLARPVIFFQGLEDRVVPPNQARAMVDALASRGVAHALVEFAGEGHGFRRSTNIRAALECELYFYGAMLGFDVDVHPPEVRIVAGTGAAG